MRGDRVEPFGDRQAGRVRGHDEGRETLRARALAGAGEERVDIGDAAVRDPCLLAVEDESVAVVAGGHGGIGDVGARLRLGQGEGGDGLARSGQRQPFGLLVGRAEERERTGAEALHREGEIGEPVVARERLAAEAEGPDVEGLRVSGVDGGRLEPAVRAKAARRDRGRPRRCRDDRAARAPRPSRPALRHGCGGAARGTASRDRSGRPSIALEDRFFPGGEGLEGAGEVLRSACRSPGPAPRPRSPGRATSTIPGSASSWSSCDRNSGPPAIRRAMSCAAASRSSRGTTRFQKPQAAPSSALMERPV